MVRRLWSPVHLNICPVVHFKIHKAMSNFVSRQIRMTMSKDPLKAQGNSKIIITVVMRRQGATVHSEQWPACHASLTRLAQEHPSEEADPSDKQQKALSRMSRGTFEHVGQASDPTSQIR